MTSDAVEKIKERMSILDVVAPYVELHKAGKSYKGKSPFTSEKTPSFYVSPDRGMYYCFSSSQGGDIFTFIQKMEGVDFKGALKILAEKAGVELVPEDPKKRSERDQLYHALADATKFYMDWLTKAGNSLKYLLSRGVTEQTIHAWEIGYAPGPPQHGWRHVREHLLGKRYTDTDLGKAGLIKTAETGKEPYDVFRDRIMFPIRDASGRVVGFSGRILAKDSEAPKYVNSPETELFNKSEILFGFDKAKQGIRHYDFSLIVEGQFDVVLSHQAGYTNAVAVSGTALTPHHVSLLQRLSNRVVLALDADRAGIAAVKRAADLMLSRGMDVKVARLPAGEDPADIVRKEGKRLREYIGKATHVIEFLLAVVREETADERKFKLRVRDEVVPYLVKIESGIDREHFEGVVADALGSTRDAVRMEVARIESKPDREKREPGPGDTSVVGGATDSPLSRKARLLAYCVAVDGLLQDYEREVFNREFSAITGAQIDAHRAETPTETVNALTFRLEEMITGMQLRELHHELAHMLTELRRVIATEEMKKKHELLKAAEAGGDDAIVSSLMEELTVLQKTIGLSALEGTLFEKKM